MDCHDLRFATVSQWRNAFNQWIAHSCVARNDGMHTMAIRDRRYDNQMMEYK